MEWVKSYIVWECSECGHAEEHGDKAPTKRCPECRECPNPSAPEAGRYD